MSYDLLDPSCWNLLGTISDQGIQENPIDPIHRHICMKSAIGMKKAYDDGVITIKTTLKPAKEKEMFVKDANNIFVGTITNIIQQDGYTIILSRMMGKTIVKTYKKDYFDRELGLLTCLAKHISTDKTYRDLKKCFVNGHHSTKNAEINKALVKGFILNYIPLKTYNKLWEAFKEKYND